MAQWTTNKTAKRRVSSTPNHSLVPSVAMAATLVKTVGTAAATVAMIPFFNSGDWEAMDREVVATRAVKVIHLKVGG